MNNFSVRRHFFSLWHCFFFFLFFLLFLFCVRQRLRLKSVNTSADAKMSNQSDNRISPVDDGIVRLKRLRRRFMPFKLELFENILSRKDFFGAEQLSKFERIFDRYNRSRKSDNQTIGMRYVDTFLPGEMNLTKLDKETLKQLQTMEIVDAMANSGGELVEKQIEEVIRRHAQLNEVWTQGETRHELQTDAWDVCLGEQHTLCNGHLSVLVPFWHCVCSVSPFRLPSASASLPLCSSAFLLQNVPSKVITVPLLFPLPALFSFQSLLPQLMDSFLAHWLSITFHHRIKFDQVLFLRKQCLNEHFFVIQFAFLKKSAYELVNNDGKGTDNGQMVKIVRDDHLLNVKKNRQFFRTFRRALWTEQTVMEMGHMEEDEEIVDLLAEEMRETQFFREKVAKLGDDVSQCLPPWDYKSFVLCHPRDLLFISVASVFVLGVPVGAFRFYHQMMTTEEQRGRNKRQRGKVLKKEQRQQTEEEEEEEEEEGKEEKHLQRIKE